MVCAYADSVSVISADIVKIAIEELQWVPYAERTRTRSVKKDNLRDSEMSDILQNNTQALVDVSKNLGQLDTLVATLSVISTRLGNVESLLKHITRALQRDEKEAEVRKKTSTF
jgi:hypothetical protein